MKRNAATGEDDVEIEALKYGEGVRKEIFLRWVMGVSWSYTGYMLREETGGEKWKLGKGKDKGI